MGEITICNPMKNSVAEALRQKIKPPCTRILLIHPQQMDEQDFRLDTALGGRYWAYPPYGCGVLARNLENRGYSTSILDLNFELLNAVHSEKENFTYNFWESVLVNKLNSFAPDIVCISCMFSMSHNIMNIIARRIKVYNQNIPIIIGGVHPTNSRKIILNECPDADFLGFYECDRSLPDLVDFINGKADINKLTQLSARLSDEIVTVEDRSRPTAQEMDVTPLYHNIPVGKYSKLGQVGTYGFLRKGRATSSVLSNRGCRAHCSFCNVPAFNGTGVRERSIESVIHEIQELYHVHGIRHISWLDDDLLSGRDRRAVALFNAIADLKLDLTWDASNGLIAAFVTKEVMDAMAASGCIGFNLGIESGNPEILKSVHKPGTVDSFRKCKEVADQYPHIFIKGFLIVGFPNETLAQILDTVNLALELQLDWYSIQILNPLPSTEIYEKMINDGMIQDTLNTNKAAYVFGPNGRSRLREERENITAQEFFNLFSNCQLNEVPRQDQLGDYLFLMDYKINYEIIFSISHPTKMANKDTALQDICTRIAPHSPLAHLFYGITRQKLGDPIQAKVQAGKVHDLVAQNAYWQKRFEVLDLYPIIDSLK